MWDSIRLVRHQTYSGLTICDKRHGGLIYGIIVEMMDVEFNYRMYVCVILFLLMYMCNVHVHIVFYLIAYKH